MKLKIWAFQVNFTNILRAAFLFESFARSYFVLAVKVKLFIGVRILAQMRFKNVGEIGFSERHCQQRRCKRSK
jgi:hypothetical protein